MLPIGQSPSGNIQLSRADKHVLSGCYLFCHTSSNHNKKIIAIGVWLGGDL